MPESLPSPSPAPAPRPPPSAPLSERLANELAMLEATLPPAAAAGKSNQPPLPGPSPQEKHA